jgi:hypothetical protein
MATLAEMLRQGADKLINLPSEAQRFVTNPQAFTQLLTGKNPLPKETGFAAGATGLTPDQMSVLDPNQMEYMKGYEQGEPFGIAAMALPLAVPAAKALAPKAGQMAENYMVNQGFMPSVVPPSPAKMADALRQPEKNALGFYSPLDEAVMNLQNQKGTGQQYLAQLLKTQGVKQEEVATRGLDTFLTQNPKVTKTQIKDFLNQNPVQIKETVLGGSLPEPKFKQIEPDLWESNVGNIYKQGKDDYAFIVGGEGDMHYFNSFDEAQDFAKNFAKTDEGAVFADNTKFKDYTLPAGENYREVLIQYDPKKAPAKPVYSVEADTMSQSFDTKLEAEAYKAQLQQQYPNANIPITQTNITANPKYAQTPDFKSSHFNEPNILAHMRVTDRNIDGKKTLFVEEIQSDWHQAGRKKGYQESLLTDAERKRWDELKAKDNKNAITDADRPEFQALAEKVTAEMLAKKDGVPNAPFKKNWQELAMKRAMQMAAEGGYDRVAFTTGKQQADRFSLSKQINDLTITRTPTEFKISATDLNGKPAISQSIPDLRNLDEYVGKDLANKIKDDFANKSGQKHNYSGLDLEVGGEGMKGFYDKILPEFVNKYGKKNNLKVGQTNLPTNDMQYVGFQDFYKWVKSKDPSKSYESAQNAFKKKDSLYKEFVEASPVKGEEVHYFDLTPEAKTSFISKGQPMFAAAPIVATDEETRREMLEKLFNSQ